AQGVGQGPIRGQAQRPDAREVGARNAIRGHSARPRLSCETALRRQRGLEIGAVTLAFVAPAGGANPGDGVTPVPAHTVFVYRHPSPPPGTKVVVGGRRSDPPSPALYWAPEARLAGFR